MTTAMSSRATGGMATATSSTTMRYDDGNARHRDGDGRQDNARHNDGTGQHSDGRHDDSDGQQSDRRHDNGNKWHDDTAKQGQWGT